MRTVKPDFFNDFKCIAGDCPCTCCSGWQIMIDEKSLNRYKNYKGKMGKNFTNSIDFEEGAFLQCENNDCAFLNKDGLCDMIIAEGEDILCDTCRLYPRHVEEYEDLREWGMTLSCPEFARLLVERTTPLTFEVVDDDEPDPLEDEFEDFDFMLFDKLLNARETILKIARNKDLSMQERTGLILEMAERLQQAYDEDEDFKMDEISEEFASEAFIKENAEEMALSFAGFIREDFRVYDQLERLSDSFDNFLADIKYYPYSKADSYKRNDLLIENLLVSYLYTYFLGAVYNGMIYAYVQYCLFLCISMDALAIAKEEKLGRKLTNPEYEEVIYLISREVEHSDPNICTMLEYFDL